MKLYCMAMLRFLRKKGRQPSTPIENVSTEAKKNKENAEEKYDKKGTEIFYQSGMLAGLG